MTPGTAHDVFPSVPRDTCCPSLLLVVVDLSESLAAQGPKFFLLKNILLIVCAVVPPWEALSKVGERLPLSSRMLHGGPPRG
jgi:hypothetical protein